MSDLPFDFSRFHEGIRVLRLGSLAPLGDAWNITVKHQSDGRLEGFNLKQQRYELFRDIDPTDASYQFTSEEQAFLVEAERHGAVRLLDGDAGLSQLDFVTVPRRRFALVGETEDGYDFEVENGQRFVLTEVGARLLAASDRASSVTDAAEEVIRDMLEDADDQAVVHAAEASTGRPFEQLIVDEVLAFAKQLMQSGAATFEPKV